MASRRPSWIGNTFLGLRHERHFLAYIAGQWAYAELANRMVLDFLPERDFDWADDPTNRSLGY